MAITLIDTETNADDNSHPVNLNFSAFERDLVLVVGGFDAGLTNTPGPTTAGYTSIISTSTNMKLSAHYKIMGASPDPSVDCQAAAEANTACAYVCYVFRNVDLINPIDATATSATGTGTTPDSPSITTVTNGAAIITAFGSDVDDASSTVPTGYLDKIDDNDGDSAGNSTVGMAWLIQAAAGAIDPGSWAGVDSGNWAAFTIALRPAATTNYSRGYIFG